MRVGLVLIVLLLVAAGAGAYVYSQKRALASARQSFDRRAARPRVRAAASQQLYSQILKHLDHCWRLSGGHTLRELDERRNASNKLCLTIQQSLARLNASLPLGVEEASHGELEGAEPHLLALTEALDAQDVALDILLNLGSRIDYFRVVVPARHQLLIDEVDAAAEFAAELAAAGLVVAAEIDALSELKSGLVSVATQVNRLDLDAFTFNSYQRNVEPRLFKIERRLRGAAGRSDSFNEWRKQIGETHDLQMRRIESAQLRFAELSPLHHPDSWQWAQELPDRVLGQLESAATLLRTTKSEANAAAELDEIERSLEAASAELLLADGVLDQIDDLFVDLDRARLESRGVMDQLKAVLASTNQLVGNRAVDVAPHVREVPNTLVACSAELERELKLERPNFLRVTQTGDRLNRVIDSWLAEGHDAKQASEALHRQGEREVARAQRSLQRARVSAGWQLTESLHTEALDRLAKRLNDLPAEAGVRLGAASKIADAAVAIRDRVIVWRRRDASWVAFREGKAWSANSWSVESGWSGAAGDAVNGGAYGGSIGGGVFIGSAGTGSFSGGCRPHNS